MTNGTLLRTGARKPPPNLRVDMASRTVRTDRLPVAMRRWLGMAVRELGLHTPVDGLCCVCGAAWPCVTCQRAEFALGSCW
jgi:hypothetical protein